MGMVLARVPVHKALGVARRRGRVLEGTWSLKTQHRRVPPKIPYSVPFDSLTTCNLHGTAEIFFTVNLMLLYWFLVTRARAS